MKLFVYEGSPKEIAEVAHLMGTPVQTHAKSNDAPQVAEEAVQEDEELSIEQVKLVLKRRPLPTPILKMLQLLYEAGEDRVKSDDIKKHLSYSNPEFRGMLGAFGRRLKNTQGIPKGVKLFDEAWDEELRQKTWTLPVNVRQSLEYLKIVKK